ncbi:MAG: hypothetical protein R3B40_13690 [Polyangiales bacterium]|nr:hypothetical protein [Sandaracinaceae bacterium]
MSTPRIDDTLLQRLLDQDADLSDQERDDALAILAESEVDQGRVRVLERLSQFVADVSVEDGALLSEAESSQMFDHVWATVTSADGSGSATGLDASGEPAPGDSGVSDGRKRPKLRLIEGEGLGTLPPNSKKIAFEPKLGPDAAPPTPASQPAPAADSGAKWPGLVAVALLAAAAVAALALRPEPTGRPAPVAEVIAPEAPAPMVVEDEPEVIVASHHGTEVEEIDFGANMGTVFQVPGERNVPVAVVWISDEEFVR